MFVSNEDIKDLMNRVVREIRVKEEKRERFNVAVKMYKFNVYKDRIYNHLVTSRRPHYIRFVEQSHLYKRTLTGSL